MEDDAGVRTRSFREEDYNYRRVFLRSYPLQWGDEEEDQGEEEEKKKAVGATSSKLSSLKSKLRVLLQWSGRRVVTVKRLKEKVVLYSLSCHPFGFKSSNKLLIKSH